MITDRNQEFLETADKRVYKDPPAGDPLEVYLFSPPEHRTDGDPAAAMLFFFSSGWDTPALTQFVPHCACFAERGMVAAVCNYRVEATHGTGPLEAMEDARDAFRWVRRHAGEMGIDPSRVVGAGGSGGAFLVACAALSGGGPNGDGMSLTAPDAMVLFSPVLDVSRKGFGLERFPDEKSAKEASPVKRVRKELPPTILFHASADRLVPVGGSRRFAKAMRRKKNVCELVEYEGVGHSFFNCNVDYERFGVTVDAADAFLVEQGVLGPLREDDAG